MAVVHMTKELVKNILENVERLYAENIEAAKNYPVVEWGEEAYRIIVPEEIEAKLRELPRSYVHYQRELVIRWNNSYGQTIRVSLSESKPFPFQCTVEHDKCYGTSSGLTVDTSKFPEWLTLYAKYTLWKENHDAAVKAKTDAVMKTKETLNKFATLGPALKAWPALWDLLPAHAKAKHNEVVTRTKRDPAQLDLFDDTLGGITVAITKQKLSNGSS